MGMEMDREREIDKEQKDSVAKTTKAERAMEFEPYWVCVIFPMRTEEKKEANRSRHKGTDFRKAREKGASLLGSTQQRKEKKKKLVVRCIMPRKIEK